MKMKSIIAVTASATIIALLSLCTPASDQKESAEANTPPTPDYHGYASKEQWGEHLVTICGCNDCHTPKKMVNGMMMLDSTKLLSGHPAEQPAPDVDRKAMEQKGNVVTQTLTAWSGPWGVSYAANLTSHPTGTGNWEESNFVTAIRHGKFKGIESGRTLLPPMPWDMYRHMTDEELSAVFAFLKSTKPIENVVPPPMPPELEIRN
jgi:hypothetical protein